MSAKYHINDETRTIRFEDGRVVSFRQGHDWLGWMNDVRDERLRVVDVVHLLPDEQVLIREWTEEGIRGAEKLCGMFLEQSQDSLRRTDVRERASERLAAMRSASNRLQSELEDAGLTEVVDGGAGEGERAPVVQHIYLGDVNAWHFQHAQGAIGPNARASGNAFVQPSGPTADVTASQFNTLLRMVRATSADDPLAVAVVNARTALLRGDVDAFRASLSETDGTAIPAIRDLGLQLLADIVESPSPPKASEAPLRSTRAGTGTGSSRRK